MARILKIALLFLALCGFKLHSKTNNIDTVNILFRTKLMILGSDLSDYPYGNKDLYSNNSEFYLSNYFLKQEGLKNIVFYKFFRYVDLIDEIALLNPDLNSIDNYGILIDTIQKRYFLNDENDVHFMDSLLFSVKKSKKERLKIFKEIVMYVFAYDLLTNEIYCLYGLPNCQLFYFVNKVLFENQDLYFNDGNVLEYKKYKKYCFNRFAVENLDLKILYKYYERKDKKSMH